MQSLRCWALPADLHPAVPNILIKRLIDMVLSKDLPFQLKESYGATLFIRVDLILFLSTRSICNGVALPTRSDVEFIVDRHPGLRRSGC